MTEGADPKAGLPEADPGWEGPAGSLSRMAAKVGQSPAPTEQWVIRYVLQALLPQAEVLLARAGRDYCHTEAHTFWTVRKSSFFVAEKLQEGTRIPDLLPVCRKTAVG